MSFLRCKISGSSHLTKGTIYPIVKKVALTVGIRMTKQIFADGVASFVPVIGGALSGGLTFVMFKPGCMKLRKNLMSYNLCEPDYYKNVVEAEYVDFEVVDEEVILDNGE